MGPRLLLRRLRVLAGTALDAVLPPRCLACLEPAWGTSPICAACARAVPQPVPRCPRCARRVGVANPPSRCELGCPACVGPLAARDALARADASDPLGPVDHVIAVYPYADTPRELVLALKFGGRLDAAQLLGDALAETLYDADVPGDLIVPVPLSTRRHRQRGYNQAEVLAREVALRLDVACDPRALARRRHTKRQATLSLRARLLGPRGAFVAKRERVVGRCVILVDDVITSAATARACALALCRAGAESVVAAVACRAD